MSVLSERFGDDAAFRAKIRAAEAAQRTANNAEHARACGVSAEAITDHWLVRELRYDSTAYYKFSVAGWNGMSGERFSWQVPALVGSNFALHPLASDEVKKLFSQHWRADP